MKKFVYNGTMVVGQNIPVRLYPTTIEVVRKLAEQERRPVGQLLRILVEDGLKSRGLPMR